MQQQQNITLKEFGGKSNLEPKLIDRFSRMEYMQVPAIDFYQLKVSYETLIIDDANDPAGRLRSKDILALADISLIHQQDMEGNLIASVEQENKDEVRTSFRWWLYQLAKESFGMVTVADLKKCEAELQAIFAMITTEKDGVLIENGKYNHQRIRSLIRQAFAPRRDFTTKEEILPEQACLLQIEHLTSPTQDCEKFFPDQQAVHEIITWDEKPPQQELTAEQKAKIAELEALGIDVSALRNPKLDPHPERNQTYHYLPYRFDSGLEKHFLSQELLPLIKEKALEVYFNGDDTLTEFKIDCYKRVGTNWRYIGRYVPDFLLLSRNEQKQIDKVIIIETKGEGFAAKFKDKLSFMSEFVKKNNDKFGYQRFDFLYLEDTITAEQRRKKTLAAINNFFNV